MSIRSSNYSHNEDVLLCEIYIQISQDPTKGNDQSGEEFLGRVEFNYNTTSKVKGWEIRTARFLQAQIQIIEKVVRKFHGCLRNIKGAHQSGINNKDVIDKAIELLVKDPKFKKGWKFHHVWSTIGDFEKFKGCAKGSKKKMRDHNLSASENQTPDSQDSQGMSSFSMNLVDDDDDEIGGSSSLRPIGMKKAKNKAYKDEATASLLENFRYDNRQYMEEMKASNEFLKQQMEKKNAFREMKEENKILFQDTSLIQDQHYRAFVKGEQSRILHKRAQQSSQPDPFATGSYPSYFNNLGGSSSDIPDY